MKCDISSLDMPSFVKIGCLQLEWIAPGSVSKLVTQENGPNFNFEVVTNIHAIEFPKIKHTIKKYRPLAIVSFTWDLQCTPIVRRE